MPPDAITTPRSLDLEWNLGERPFSGLTWKLQEDAGLARCGVLSHAVCRTTGPSTQVLSLKKDTSNSVAQGAIPIGQHVIEVTAHENLKMSTAVPGLPAASGPVDSPQNQP